MKKGIIGAILAGMVFVSCAGVKNIPPEYTASQLIQHGQNAADMGFYRNAEAYYTCAMERYGTDGQVYVETRYELGHLHIRTKKWQKAYEELREIVSMYEGSMIGMSPVTPTFYKLAKIELDKIPAKQLPSIEAHILKEHEKAAARAAAQEIKETSMTEEDAGAVSGEDTDDGESATEYTESEETEENNGAE